jgi:glutamine amidotransferase-like uncharacterized protein
MTIINRPASFIYFCLTMVIAISFAVGGEIPNGQAAKSGQSEKYALVYNGPVSEEDCPEAAAAIAKAVGLEVKFVSRIEELPRMLKDTAVFVIGGTGDDLQPLLKEFTPKVTQAFKEYLHNGGRYLGICGGGFMASTGWEEDGAQIRALGVIPAKCEVFRQEFAARILPIRWLGKTRPMYFKAGPSFEIIESAELVEVLAYYDDGSIAALLSSYGKGKIAVCGPHPEAKRSWSAEAADGDKWISSSDLAIDLLKDLLSDRPIKTVAGHDGHRASAFADLGNSVRGDFQCGHYSGTHAGRLEESSIPHAWC